VNLEISMKHPIVFVVAAVSALACAGLYYLCLCAPQGAVGKAPRRLAGACVACVIVMAIATV
jgi:hypothetical protein